MPTNNPLRTGLRMLVTAVKTSAYSAVAGDDVRTDTSGGVFNVTLPAVPTDGDQLAVTDVTASWQTNNLTLVRGDVAHKINGISASYGLSGGGRVILRWAAASSDWRFLQEPVLPISMPIVAPAFSGANNTGYIPPLRCVFIGTGLNLNTQREYYVPIEWPARGPMLGLGTYVVTAVAASTIVAAIYRRLSDWSLGARLARVTFNSATTGFKTSTFAGVPIELGAPLWACIYSDGATVAIQTSQTHVSGPHNVSGYSGAQYTRDSIALASAFPSTGPALSALAPQNSSATVNLPWLGVA
jgi:hypothetical protein